jgi:hypothetical protein
MVGVEHCSQPSLLRFLLWALRLIVLIALES